jgi:membrane-bound serine protease (ClpP class)
MYYTMRIHRRVPVSGPDVLIQKECVVIEDINGMEGGKVFIEGEYWNAVSGADIKKGEKARVVEVNGMVLKVERAQSI